VERRPATSFVLLAVSRLLRIGQPTIRRERCLGRHVYQSLA
jgi:hypothetical protein